MYLPEEIQNKIMLYLSTPSADCIRHHNRSTPSADCIRHLMEHIKSNEPLEDIVESHMMRLIPEYEDYDAEVLVKLWDIPRLYLNNTFTFIKCPAEIRIMLSLTAESESESEYESEYGYGSESEYESESESSVSNRVPRRIVRRRN